MKHLVEDVERERRKGEDAFGLAFGLGQICERLADQLPREERAEWLTRAVQAYQDALTWADAGTIAGYEWVPATAFGPETPGTGRVEQVVLATAFHLGVLLCADFRVRDPPRAIALLRRVADRTSGYHPAWYYLGEAHLLASQFDDAERVWRVGLARAPEEGVLRAVLRNLPIDRLHDRVKAGDWNAVLAELQRVPRDLMPEAERLATEGDAYRELGDRDRAVARYREAIKIDPHVVDARRKLRQLEREGSSEVIEALPPKLAALEPAAREYRDHYNENHTENHGRDRI